MGNLIKAFQKGFKTSKKYEKVLGQIAKINAANKPLVDCIYKTTVKAPISPEKAYSLLSGSSYYKRDSEIIIMLACYGIDIDKIKEVIKCLNS